MLPFIGGWDPNRSIKLHPNEIKNPFCSRLNTDKAYSIILNFIMNCVYILFIFVINAWNKDRKQNVETIDRIM